MHKDFPVVIIFAGVLSLVASCTDQRWQNEAMPTRTDGAVFFARNCASCHGADGHGSGLAARDPAAIPTDLTRLSEANGGTFPAARTLSYIYGDPDNSHLARVMPQFGGKMAEALVPVDIEGVLTPTPRELAGLLAYLESVQE